MYRCWVTYNWHLQFDDSQIVAFMTFVTYIVNNIHLNIFKALLSQDKVFS